jgi:hypothetical protein
MAHLALIAETKWPNHHPKAGCARAEKTAFSHHGRKEVCKCKGIEHGAHRRRQYPLIGSLTGGMGFGSWGWDVIST